MALDATSTVRAASWRSDPSRRPLRDSLRGDLVWRRPGVFRREIELWAGSEKLAALRFTGWFRGQAVGESRDGAWTFERIGFFRGRFRVRDAASQAEIGRFEREWLSRGTLRLATGIEYRWSGWSVWRARWGWSVGKEERFLCFRSIMFRGGLEMEVQPQALRVADLPVLVLAGAYLMQMFARARAS